ncbi:MAG: transglutaminase domain-containing protein [Candidatus Dadabacteria bacterium]|nr:MAG: transglutaminase domain-containing protein [Candidatus Dadabacteria bacterium]
MQDMRLSYMNNLLDKESNNNPIRWEIAVIAARAVFLAIFVFSFDNIVGFGTNPYLLAAAGILGIFAGRAAAKAGILPRGLFAVAVAVLVACMLFSALLYRVGLYFITSPLRLYAFTEHCWLVLVFFIFCAIATFLYWKYRSIATVELCVLSGACVYFLSPHRDYNLAAPQAVNSLAWYFGVSPQAMFVICGIAAVAVLILYLISSSYLHGEMEGERKVASTSVWIARSAAIGAILVLYLFVAGVGRYVYLGYDIEEGRTTNGVGQGSKKGESPLGFHSALGTNNQPAALVRLESDYPENPFSPMLYFRESALSSFNGYEMVIAGKVYDADVNFTHPSEPYTGAEDHTLKGRKPLSYSVYLLSNQKDAFAIDYPIEIKQIKNPNPKRFTYAYKAKSLVPSFKLKDLQYADVGNPRWSEEVLEHYIQPHPDQRYTNLAIQLTEDYEYPVQKILAIVDYFNKNATYTLTPNHPVSKDPVAPFLFGDLRGYCVHFAHAIVYLLRAIGIPARIGVGYLTDLSQSKDGHILLRMSDRHSWPEVYVKDYGWIPFDVQPENVESHGVTDVDMKLLQELMDEIGPDQELLSDDLLKGEKGAEKKRWQYNISLRTLLIGLIVLLVAYLSAKLSLRYGWLFRASPAARLTASYRALLYELRDLGFRRKRGETKREFELRLAGKFAANPLPLTEMVIEHCYRKPPLRGIDIRQIDKLREKGKEAINSVPRWKRIVSLFNPLSLIDLFSRR